MVIGNPCDDWNWMEELNRYMDVPRNHPGAFADVGFEHDAYEAKMFTSTATAAVLRFTNVERRSKAFGMVKEMNCRRDPRRLTVRYQAAAIARPAIDSNAHFRRIICNCCGAHDVARLRRGCKCTWVPSRASHGLGRTEDCDQYANAVQERCGHGCVLRLVGFRRARFALDIE